MSDPGQSGSVIPFPARVIDDAAPDAGRSAPARASTTAGAGLQPAIYYLLARLRNWTDIGREEIAALRDLPSASTARLTDAAAANSVAVLSCGAAFAYRCTRDGERHISAVFHPGEIVNYGVLSGVASRYQIEGKSARYEMVDLQAFRQTCERFPLLSWLLSRYESAKTCFLTDRFCAAIRSRAPARLLRLLLELKAQEELASAQQSDRFKLWFTQRELGDMTGLTPVYVSKTFSELERRGQVSRIAGNLRFSDRASLETECGFNNYFASLASERARRNLAPALRPSE